MIARVSMLAPQPIDLCWRAAPGAPGSDVSPRPWRPGDGFGQQLGGRPGRGGVSAPRAVEAMTA